MSNFKKPLCLFFLCVLLTSQNGCALLQVPLQLIKIPFSILGTVFEIVKRLPKPPPWVFLFQEGSQDRYRHINEMFMELKYGPEKEIDKIYSID